MTYGQGYANDGWIDVGGGRIKYADPKDHQAAMLEYQQMLMMQQQQQQAPWPMNTRSAMQGDCTVRVGRVTSVTPGSQPNMRNITLYFGRPFGPKLAEFTLTYLNVGSGWPIFMAQVNTLWSCWVRYQGSPGQYVMELCQDKPPTAVGTCPDPTYADLCQGTGAAVAPTGAPTSACANHYGMVTGMKELGPAGREVTISLGGGHIGVVEKTFVVKPWDGTPGTEDPLYKAPLYSMWNVPFDSAGNRCGPHPSILFERCGKEGVVGQWYPLCTLDPRISQACQGPHLAIVTANAGGKLTLKVRVDKQTVQKTVEPPKDHMMLQAPVHSIWKVHLRKDNGSVCTDPNLLIFVTNRCKSLKEYEICSEDPLWTRNCKAIPGIVMKISAGGGGAAADPADPEAPTNAPAAAAGGTTRTITLRFDPTGKQPFEDVYVANSREGIFYAGLHSIWSVHVDNKNKVCQDPVLGSPAQIRAKCTTLTEHALCKYDPILARGCQKTAGIVMKVTAAAGGAKDITFRFDPTGKAPFDAVFRAKPTDMPVFNALPYSVWEVAVDKEKKVCQGEGLPLPAMLKDKCVNASTHPLCKHDPEIARGCKHVPALVTQITPAAGGARVVKLALNPTGKSQFTRDVTVKSGDLLYHAQPFSIWNVALDTKNAVCQAPTPAQLKDKCAKKEEHPLCALVPEFSCTAEAGLILKAEDQTNGDKKVTILFNPGGKGKLERAHVAKAGQPLYYAEQGEVWRVHLDSKRNVCVAPIPVKLQESCKPNDPLAVCNKCEKTEATPGVVMDVAKTSNGGCAVTMAYLKDDKSKQAVTGIAELPPGTNCDAFKQGQMLMVLRSAEDGSFCGLQQPVTPKDGHCTRPFTPANQELCAYACTKVKCDLAGCESGEKTAVPAIAVEAPTIAGEQYVLTFVYPKGEGPSIGTLRTLDKNARFIKKGQAYTVYKDARTEALCELGSVSPLVDFCAQTDADTKMLCKAACQYVPGLCSPTKAPDGGGGGGLGDLNNIDLKVRLGNQNDGVNRNSAGGGLPGGAYYGPGGLLYPGGVGGGGFILPPDKYVLPVPTMTDTHIIGAYPAPQGDNLLGDGPHGSRRWDPNESPPTPVPTAAPLATFQEDTAADEMVGDDERSPVDEAALLEGTGGGSGPVYQPAPGPPPPPDPAPPPPQPAWQRWLWIALAVVLAALAGYGAWQWWKNRGASANNTEAVIFM